MRAVIFILAASCGLSGCAVIAVADAVVTTGATVVKAGVKTVGAVVDAVIPEKKPEPEKDKRQSDYKTAPHTTTGSASSRIPKRP